MKRAPWAFGVRRLEGTPLPLVAKSTLASRPFSTAEVSPDARVTVMLSAEVSDALGRSMPMSRDIEEGGFLFGRAFRDAEAEDRFLVLVTEAIRATHAEGTKDELSFGADSFAAIHQRVHEMHGQGGVLGWYHTHLVPESGDEGLSLIDRDLHFTTFRMPWQIAGLVCVDPARDPEGRRISFYERRGDELIRCGVEVIG
jgi:proteasome lid subunit RPN8/RPN11